jgi:hypothetical protein
VFARSYATLYERRALREIRRKTLVDTPWLNEQEAMGIVSNNLAMRRFHFAFCYPQGVKYGSVESGTKKNLKISLFAASNFVFGKQFVNVRVHF